MIIPIFQQDVAPIHLAQGDTLAVRHTGLNGQETLAEYAIEKPQIINRIVIAQVEDEVGLIDGMGVFIGRKK